MNKLKLASRFTHKKYDIELSCNEYLATDAVSRCSGDCQLCCGVFGLLFNCDMLSSGTVAFKICVTYPLLDGFPMHANAEQTEGKRKRTNYENWWKIGLMIQVGADQKKNSCKNFSREIEKFDLKVSRITGQPNDLYSPTGV